MSYDASFQGTLIPRNGAEEKKIEEALEVLFEKYYKSEADPSGLVREVYGDDKYEGDYDKLVAYEVYGNDRYREEDYDDLAKIFDGKVDFVGDDDTRWSLFLKDGKVRETSPLEFLPKPGETPEQTIGRCIAGRGLNIRQILESMPDFVAAKLWITEDVTNKMSEMDIDDETQKAILPEAVNLINKKQLEECTDSEWDTIETGIEDALKELGKGVIV